MKLNNTGRKGINSTVPVWFWDETQVVTLADWAEPFYQPTVNILKHKK